MAYKLKLNEHNQVVLQDGKPVYISDDGNEMAFDANEAFNKMHSLREESKGRRLDLEKAKESLKAFEGIDLELVKKNADIAEKFKEHEAVKNGELDKLKQELISTSERKLSETKALYENQINALTGERDGLLNSLNDNILNNHFLNSKYVVDKLQVPADMVKAMFGSKFKVDRENNNIYAVGEDGSPLLSEKKLGSVASFEEALEMIVKKYPHKDSILKNEQQGGGGMSHNGGRGSLKDDPILKNGTAEQKLAAIRKRQASRS